MFVSILVIIIIIIVVDVAISFVIIIIIIIIIITSYYQYYYYQFLLLFTALEIDLINVNNHILCMLPTLFVFFLPPPLLPHQSKIYNE